MLKVEESGPSGSENRRIIKPETSNLPEAAAAAQVLRLSVWTSHAANVYGLIGQRY